MIVTFTAPSLPAVAEEAPPPRIKSPVDATTLHHKVLCGYQGWFRCPGDPARQGWRHWSRNGRMIGAGSLSFEMWPDMAEYDDDEKYATPGFMYPDGKPAHLFSSANPKTVDRHFRWMEQYGIDGVFLQRFLVDLNNRSGEQVLTHVRAAAAKTGRAYALCYDLTDAPKDKLFDTLTADWKRLVDEAKVTGDSRYLRHNGKPVLFVWGFYSDRFGPDLANRVIDFFKNDPKYGVTLVGGCQWAWRTEKDLAWAKVFRRFDVISPWNVGNFERVDGRKYAATGYWKDDLEAAKKAGMAYLPVIYPGFSWVNLKGRAATRDTMPRMKGEFFWQQFSAAADLGIDMAYVAMFDEVDEGTAILKVSNTPPTPGRFATYEGLPSDWYLRLTGEGTKVIRGERKNQKTVPIEP
ncbi:Glycosyl hydrolase family 99 [Fimbriiglobus ruber]|uniref:Glycosyl hydrolase family 99 n=1 Tax=Fimbriiglobus ruber TaxID=1908690 RepID=A0A225DRC4_9BACT|nr:Glycosyl hydrolase family 99 [Fimbriiglobus ruber]